MRVKYVIIRELALEKVLEEIMQPLTLLKKSSFFCLFCVFAFLAAKLSSEETFREIWRYPIGRSVKGVAYDSEGERIFCGSDDHSLHCLDSNGGLLWTYKTEEEVRGVAYDPEGKRIFCGSRDNHLYCLNSEGKLLWKYKTGNYIEGVAYDAEGKRIFCGSFDNYLYCLNSEGQLLWAYETGGNVYGVAYDPENKRIFCGSDDHSLHCLDSNGGLLWTYNAEEEVRGVAYDPEGKRIFCGSFDNYLYCLDSDGEILWKYRAGNCVEGVAYDAERKRIFCCSQDNRLYCFDSEGKLLWDYNAGLIGWHLSLALDIDNQRIFFPSNNGLMAMHYSILVNPNSSSIRKMDIEGILKELERLREEKSIAKKKELQVVINVCPQEFPEAICTPISSESIYSVELNSTSKKHTLWRMDPYLKKEKIKEFPPIFSLSNPPIMDREEAIYFVSSEGKICQLIDGQEFILFDMEKYSSPTVGNNGFLYFSSKGGSLVCIDPQTGGTLWKEESKSKKIWPSPAVDDKGTAYFASRDTLYAISLKGEVLLKEKLALRIRSPLRIDPQGRLYFLSDSNILTCIDQKGNFLWKYQIYDFPEVVSPAITLPSFDGDGYAYVGSSNGKVYCIDSENGNWVWQKTLKNESPIKFFPTSSGKGEVFFLTKDGTLYRKKKLGWMEKFPFNWIF